MLGLSADNASAPSNPGTSHQWHLMRLSPLTHSGPLLRANPLPSSRGPVNLRAELSQW